MVLRSLWVERIKLAWSTRPIVWLSGVRRSGKTTLAKMIDYDEVAYRNCDLPSVSRELEDPELFFKTIGDVKVVVLDEVHQLSDPSRVLKIAADEFSNFRILATGSSTLGASTKFRDSLTGRKHSISLSPVLWEECQDAFRISDLDLRLLRGGLPEPLLASTYSDSFYSEWFDSYYARDIAELFQFRNRIAFLKLFHLLLHQSGGQIDYSRLSKEIEITRPTVISYVDALEISHAIHLVSPFHGRGRREILRRPKCYAFDTGFVAWEKGWNTIRDSDRGILWEHLVLDVLLFRFESRRVLYWRDKSGREIDFVVPKTDQTVDIFECKMNPDNVNIDSIRTFRSMYPTGRNYVVTPLDIEVYSFSRSQIVLDVIPLKTLLL